MIVIVFSAPIYAVFSPSGADIHEPCTVTFAGYEVELDSHDPVLPQIRLGLRVHAYRFVEPDDCIRDLAERIRTDTGLEGAELVERFQMYVHDSIRYVTDLESHGKAEWWQYPCETLALGTGDCEDKAFLFISLCRASGFECIIVAEPGHVSAGVLLDCPGKNTVTYDGKRYVVADPTTRTDLGRSSPDVEQIWPDHWDTFHMRFMVLDVLILLTFAAWFTRWALS